MFINCGWATLSKSSMYWVAVVSGIFLFYNDYYGGKYILKMLIRVLLGSSNLTNIPYSLYYVFSI
jgi:hypothetical protein